MQRTSCSVAYLSRARARWFSRSLISFLTSVCVVCALDRVLVSVAEVSGDEEGQQKQGFLSHLPLLHVLLLKGGLRKKKKSTTLYLFFYCRINLVFLLKPALDVQILWDYAANTVSSIFLCFLSFSLSPKRLPIFFHETFVSTPLSPPGMTVKNLCTAH